MIDRDGKLWFLDWAWPCVGVAWLDLAAFLPSVDRPAAELDAMFMAQPMGAAANPADVDTVIAALAGMWMASSFGTPLPQAPHLRRLQREFADRTLQWLAFRRG